LAKFRKLRWFRAPVVPEIADPVYLPGWLLALGGERRKSEADSENDREPDPPHGHLSGCRLYRAL